MAGFHQQPPDIDPGAVSLPQVPDLGLIPVGTPVHGIVTHYGASYSGQPLACGGVYQSSNPAIIAVGPGRDAEWPCGTAIEVCGPAGCVLTTRQDSCPGCGRFHADLSEAGIEIACGGGAGVCEVTFQRLVEQPFVLEEAPQQGEHDAEHYGHEQH
jgi:hypothetical protein